MLPFSKILISKDYYNQTAHFGYQKEIKMKPKSSYLCPSIHMYYLYAYYVMGLLYDDNTTHLCTYNITIHKFGDACDFLHFTKI